MITRSAHGIHWIFRHISHFMRTGETLAKPTAVELASAALRHARLTIETTKLSERQAILELRGQLTKYHLGIHHAAMLRSQLVQAQTLADVESILLPVVEGNYQEAL